MKEKYFSSDTIIEKSKNMLADIYVERQKHKFDFRAENSGLLVLDMQEYFLKAGSNAFIPSADAIVSNIEMLIRTFVANSRPVIFTRHINSEENAGMMKQWWKRLIRKEDPYHEIVFEIGNSFEKVIDKTQYDAFFNTNLEETLKLAGINRLVITGVMTHLCCETTARSAFMRGFEVYFVIDGTATYNEIFHRATLTNLAHGFAFPVLSEEILEKLSTCV